MARDRPLRSVEGRGGADGRPPLEKVLLRVATGDHDAFADFYDAMSGPVFGNVRRVLRDQAQSEEVTQEVFLEIWRTAPRFDPSKGGVGAWVMTMAHRRAVDRVRASQASTARDEKAGIRDVTIPFDNVSEQVETRLEQEQVRRALGTLTDLQREAVTLAYYGGHTYREVSELLDVPLGTIKTRLRDGLIRLRDHLGVDR